MIVVVGVPGWRSGDDAGPDGPSARIALAAAAAGAAVELVGRVGDDPDGDALLLALTRAGVGHAAVLRDPARPTPRITAVTDDERDPGGAAAEHRRPAEPAGPRLDAGDLELGLRYVSDYRVLVAADPLPEDTLRTIVDATAYSGARLVVLADEAPRGEALPPSATVLQRPTEDDGAFATLVGTYAAALDRGEPPDRAFRAAVTAVGGEAAED